MMITSAENRGWAGDLPIVRYALLACLRITDPSAKIATIEASQATRMGRTLRAAAQSSQCGSRVGL